MSHGGIEVTSTVHKSAIYNYVYLIYMWVIYMWYSVVIFRDKTLSSLYDNSHSKLSLISKCDYMCNNKYNRDLEK